MSDPFASDIPAAEATFSISESAQKRLSQIFTQEEGASNMLRVKVSGGGCAGYQYGFDFRYQSASNPLNEICRFTYYFLKI